MVSPFDQARQIISTGLSFRIAADSGLFPPASVINAFFNCGYDDLPGDDVLKWEAFSLTKQEYDSILAWWRTTHPQTRVDGLGVDAADFSAWFSRAVQQAR